MTRDLVADSKVELQLMKFVAEYDVPFQTQRDVSLATKKSNGQSKSCTPDLLFRQVRLAVFLDGCYWHRCEVHGPSDSRAGEIRAKDAAINAALKDQGWLVLRFWEHEDLKKAADLVVTAAYDRHCHPQGRPRGGADANLSAPRGQLVRGVHV